MQLQSENIGKIASALALAQKSFDTPKKTKTNPHLKNKYADLGDILEATRPHLNDNGVSLSQPAMQIDGREFVITQLTHGESGEWVRSYTPVFEGNQKGAQGYGSGHTYARRYGLSGLTGVVADDDDDGNAASGSNSRHSRADPKADDQPDPKAAAKTIRAYVEKITDASACNVAAVSKANDTIWASLSEKQVEYVSGIIKQRAGTLSQAPIQLEDEVPF